MEKNINYFWNAFKSRINLLLLTGGVVAGFIFGSDIPYYWLSMMGGEALVLAFLGSNSRFRKVVRAKIHAQEEAYLMQRQKNGIRTSGQKNRDRIRAIEGLARDIKKNYNQHWKQSYSSQLLENALGGVDRLEKEFTRFHYNLIKLQSIESDTRKEEHIQSTIDKLKGEIERSSSSKMKQILEKRLQILTKRLSNSGVFVENQKILSAQLDVIEDTLKYLLDESVNIYDPKIITDQIDNVLVNMDTTRETLQEIDSFVEISDYDFTSQRVR